MSERGVKHDEEPDAEGRHRECEGNLKRAQLAERARRKADDVRALVDELLRMSRGVLAIVPFNVIDKLNELDSAAVNYRAAVGTWEAMARSAVRRQE